MSTFIYDLPADKVTGTWTHDGVASSIYPIANIDDDQPWNPTIFTTNPSYILIDHTTAKRMDIISFIHCNFDLGAVIRVQRNALDVWGAPTQDVVVVIAGPSEDAFPANPYTDLSVAAGYSTGGFRYTRIKIVSGQSSLLSLGLIRLTKTKRQTEVNVLQGSGLKQNEKHPIIEASTDGDVVLGYSRGTRARTITAEMWATANAFSDLRSSWRSCRGRKTPFLLIFEPTVNEATFVKWGLSSDAFFARTRDFPGLSAMTLDWEEIGRGLAP